MNDRVNDRDGQSSLVQGEKQGGFEKKRPSPEPLAGMAQSERTRRRGAFVKRAAEQECTDSFLPQGIRQGICLSTSGLLDTHIFQAEIA